MHKAPSPIDGSANPAETHATLLHLLDKAGRTTQITPLFTVQYVRYIELPT